MKTFFNQKAWLYGLSLTIMTASSSSSIFAQDNNSSVEHKVTNVDKISANNVEIFINNPPLGGDNNHYSWTSKKSVYNGNANKPKLGVLLKGSAAGVVILKTFPNTAAAEIGLQENDRIITIDGKKTDDIKSLIRIIENHAVGDAVVVKYERNGVVQTGVSILRTASEDHYLNSGRSYKYSYSYNNSTEDLKENPCEKLELLYGKAFLGVYLSSPHSESGDGAKLTSIIKGTGAESAILKAADKITKMNQTPISNTKEAIKFIQSKKPGDQVNIQVVRENKTMLIRATLGSWADNPNSVSRISLLEEYCAESTPVEEEVPAEVVEPKENTTNTLMPIFETQAVMEVFPNPTADIVNIRFEGKKAPLTINVVGLDGKAVYTQNIQNFDGNYNGQLDLSKYPSGVYLVNLMQNDQQITQQVVVE